MPDRTVLGPWLRRFLTEYIVTERNLARNTRKSYRDTFTLFLPFVSRKLRKPMDRLAVRTYVRMRAAVPYPSRGGSRLLRSDPQSTACRDPGVRALRRQPGPGPCRMVRPYPGYRVEKIDVVAGRMADQGRDGGHAATPDRKTQAGPERIRASALSLQHRRPSLRSDPAEGLRSADRTRKSGHDLAILQGKGGRTRHCPLWPETERVLADEIIGRRAKTPCLSAGSGHRSHASGFIA